MHTFRSAPRLVIPYEIAFLLVLAVSFIGETSGQVFASPLSSSTLQRTAGQVVAADNTAVTTYKEDNARTGNHTTETILNTRNINQHTFGKRVSYPTDGQMYAQPLYLPGVIIGGVSHNVVYIATAHDSVYAFDADQTSAVAPLWHVSFIHPPSIVSPSNIDVSCNSTIPENGLIETPVIDRNTGTLYVVVMTKENGTFIQRLHALAVTSGHEKPGSPIVIRASVSGKGAGHVGGKIAFNAQTERQRAALVLSKGKIYIAWASFCDHNPYHGWIISYSYNGSRFQQVNVYNDTANSTRGGIWGAGGPISADNNGNIYYVSGNGGFDANTGGSDYGDSFVKLNARLQVLDYFTPFNEQCLDDGDTDLGSGGPLLLPRQNRIISAGKEGRIYVLDTHNMGKYHTVANVCSHQNLTNVDKVVQELPAATIGGLFSNCVYWSNARGQQFVYFAGAHDNTKLFSLKPDGTLASSPSSHTPETFGFTGGNPTLSSNNGAAGTGILWTLDPTPALRAYDATNLSKELFSSTQNSARDGLKSYVKFTAPTVANGEVFVGTGSSLDIFGQHPSSPGSTPVPSGYNNIAISDDRATMAVDYDDAGNSYSAQALQRVVSMQVTTRSILPGRSLLPGRRSSLASQRIIRPLDR